MNTKSNFTKFIAAVLAFAMVFGTLVSLRGFSVKAETSSKVTGESDTRYVPQAAQAVLSANNATDELLVTADNIVVSELSYKPDSFARNWEMFKSGMINIHLAKYWEKDGDKSSARRAWTGQAEYKEPGAKANVTPAIEGVTYYTPLGIDLWQADEGTYRGYPEDTNPEANKFWWLNTNDWFTYSADGTGLWNLVEKLIYIAEAKDSNEHKAFIDSLIDYCIEAQSERTWYYRMYNNPWSNADGGIVVNGYLIGAGSWDANGTYNKRSKDQIKANSSDMAYIELLCDAIIQSAIFDMTSGRRYERGGSDYVSHNMDSTTVNGNTVARREQTRSVSIYDPNWQAQLNSNPNWNPQTKDSYVRRMVNTALDMAKNVEEVPAERKIKYSVPDGYKYSNGDSASDQYGYKGIFLTAVKPVPSKDAYLTRDGSYNIELYVKNDSATSNIFDANNPDGVPMNSDTVIKDELSDKFEFSGTPTKANLGDYLEFKYIDANGEVKELPENVVNAILNNQNTKIEGNKISVSGFPFDQYPGCELVITVKNVVAKDIPVDQENPEMGFNNVNISTDGTNGTTVPGVYTKTGTNPAKDVNGKELVFDECVVSIRYRYIVYDFGLEMRDDTHLGEFFNDEAMHPHHLEEAAITHVLSVDYMFPKLTAYHNEYPYEGARIINDNTGSEESYKEGGYHHFEFGFVNVEKNNTDTELPFDGTNYGHPTTEHICHGYFRPNEISYRDWYASALLEIEHDADSWTSEYTRTRSGNPKYEWCLVRFIPASTVLYEVEQGIGEAKTLQNGKEKIETAFGAFWSGREKSSGNWTATAKWTLNGTFDESAYQTHFNNLYGYDTAYEGAERLASNGNGASMTVTVDDELYRLVAAGKAQWPVARFSFTGSGFSFTTTCNMTSGIFAIDVVPKGQATNYTGAAGTYMHEFVNTRYYAGQDPNGDNVITIGTGELFQVPVIRNAHLLYGDYDVYITPVYYPAWAETPTADSANTRGGELKEGDEVTSFPGLDADCYVVRNAVDNGKNILATRGSEYTAFNATIDNFRVYHPRGASLHGEAIDDGDHEAYYNSAELHTKYIEVRNIILAGIEDVRNDTEICFNGAIFIDYGPTSGGTHINAAEFNPDDPDSFTAKAYALLGPNNEMYLPNAGVFTFNLANREYVLNAHISAKVLDDKASQMKITYQYSDASNKPAMYVVKDVNSATEMYFDIAHDTEGNLLITNDLEAITVECTGEGMLSLLNIKVVYDREYTEDPGTPVTANIHGDVNTLEAANVIAFGIDGDVNFDGNASIQDAIVILRAALGITELGMSGRYCADVNRDSSIDFNDALAVLRSAIIG